MKKKTTIFKMRIVHVLSCFLLTFLCSTNFYGQTKILANTVSHTSGNKPTLLGCGGVLQPACIPTVDNPTNATANDNTYARLLASPGVADRKSTRVNSSHVKISYAVFCLKKKIPNQLSG